MEKAKSYLILSLVVIASNLAAHYLIQQWNKSRVQAPKTATA